jgi:glycosyltransferase involved in cell wall biosynthesis
MQRPEARDPAPDRTSDPAPLPSSGLRIGYVTSRFPKLTETFILYEILGLERAGVQVDLYPLLRERGEVIHPEAVPVVERAHYLPFASGSILGSQLYFLRRSPRRYLRTLALTLRGTIGSRNFFVGAVGVFPKVAHMARLMEADGVTHVHCHFATHPALAGFVIHRLTGIPYSFTAQGSDLHVDRTMLCRKVAEAELVIAISDYNRDLIVEECGSRFRDKLHVIHSGIDTAFFRPKAGERAHGPFRILSVGTLHEVKGQTYLLEACRRLAEAGVDLRADFVGEGPDRPQLVAQIAAAGLQDRVTLLGPRSRGEVADLLRSADVLVAPSVPTKEGKREGIPVVLMEALATGLPVVASRISGIPELVEDGRDGLLVPPRDAGALTEALRRLRDDPELRHRLGSQGRETVKREFDAFANAARLARLVAEASTRRTAAG